MKMKIRQQGGFTLVELIVAMFIAVFLLTGIYKIYISLNQSHFTQQQVVQMQQNARAGQYYIAKDIRLAGYDPTDEADSGITNAAANTITYTMDITGGESDGVDNDQDGLADGADDPTVGAPDESIFSDGVTDDPGEQVTFQLNGGSLQRVSNVTRTIADNIDAINFVYLGEDGATEVTDLTLIRYVQISLVCRTPKKIKGYTDDRVYQNPQGTTILGAQNDAYRRMLMTTTVKCRNLGL